MTREALQEMADKMGIQLNNLYASLSTFKFAETFLFEVEFIMKWHFSDLV